MAMKLIKENIEYEQLLGEQRLENVIKEEYVIPDVQPDVKKIVMLDAKPKITGKDVMQNKVYLEGQINYNVLYLANGDEGSEVHSVVYAKDFSNYIEINGARADMDCEAECSIEHIECKIINERKIAIEGIVQLEAEVYKNNELDIIKDVDALEDIQLLRNPSSIDKVIGKVNGELISKAHLQVPMDKPEVGKILKCDVLVHKGDVKLLDGKVQIEAFTKFQVLYKAAGSRELYSIEDDVFINNEIEYSDVDHYMDSNTEFRVDDIEIDVKEDDLGERRIVDIEALVRSETKVMHKEEFDMIEDAYSPSKMLKMDKKNYELDIILGQNTGETIIKENIEVPSDMEKPVEVINSSGKLLVTDKKIVEDKVVVEGLLDINVIYKTLDEDKYIAMLNEEIPFSCTVEVPGAKIDMECMVRAYLESLDICVEASTIAVKCVAKVYSKVTYKAHKEFLVDIIPLEDEVIKKKASITIYIVQDGDTLWKIAKKYCATVEDLVNINELESENIIVGQKLIIPGRAII